jgi:hypothetical protein
MRVYISNYRDHWISPYTILEKVFFWREIDYDEPLIEKLSDLLTPISKAIQKFLDFVRPRVVDVKIDYWDTWSMDSTLAPIILPMLKQLQRTKHGSPHCDPADIPEELRVTGHVDWSQQMEFEFDDNEKYREESWNIVHRQWEWVLNEMIFAFEHLVDESWQEKFSSGNIDTVFVPCPDNPKLSTMEHGPNHTYECDYEGIRKVEERMSNGFRLFGKYFRHLWD